MRIQDLEAAKWNRIEPLSVAVYDVPVLNPSVAKCHNRGVMKSSQKVSVTMALSLQG